MLPKNSSGGRYQVAKTCSFTNCEAILCILLQQADNILGCIHDGQAYMQRDAESMLFERIFQLNASFAG